MQCTRSGCTNRVRGYKLCKIHRNKTKKITKRVSKEEKVVYGLLHGIREYVDSRIEQRIRRMFNDNVG